MDISQNAKLRVVILKWDRLSGDMIRRQVWEVWPYAGVQVFCRGIDALNSLQEAAPDLFVTGVKVDDMDGLEHLVPFAETTLPILIVTSRVDPRTFDLLREVRYDGIYDGEAEGLDNLSVALRQVVQHRPYFSPSVIEGLKNPRKVTLDVLTDKEQVVLSVIGDGSDNVEASERLGMSPNTVGTHRKAIMRKLGVHHKGALILHALQQGYVRVTPKSVHYPGFQHQLQLMAKEPGKSDAA